MLSSSNYKYYKLTKYRVFFRNCILLCLMLIFSLGNVSLMDAAPAKRKKWIVDYRKHLNSRYKKKKRESTKYIIVHTSEAGLVSTLRTLSQGKKAIGNYRTYGGHSHYAIARDGLVYRILHHKYRADHAGLSMWNGIEDISSHSVGIELVGYHYGKITDAQYRSLKKLVKILRKEYHIPGKNVLTHSQVSYGKKNQWHKRPHRGRKRCALNFDRSRIGLANDAWKYDPDVKAKRLSQDHQIYVMFYKPYKYKKALIAKANTKSNPKETTTLQKPSKTISKTQPSLKNKSLPLQSIVAQNRIAALSNIIHKENTAWNIAGEDYDSPETLYVLPDKRKIRGNLMEKTIGWGNIPNGTRVLLNHPEGEENQEGPIFEITKEMTAWSYAEKAYNQASTFYFFGCGGMVSGLRVEDWDALPEGTRMIVGYAEPVQVEAVIGKTPWGIAGRAHNQKNTVYYFPPDRLFTGDKIKDFSDLPKGTMIFLKER